MIFIPFDELEQLMAQVLVKMGVPEADAKIVADVLITSDKRGIDSHGIGRFVPIYVDRLDDGILNPVTRLEVVKDRGATAVVDANNGFGHVAGVFATNLAMEKAKNFGLGMVAVKNSSHYGFAGYYAMMAAKEGMIGLTGTNARPSIAPTFGVENMLGTNPLTFAIPTDEEFPFVLDCATSVSQRGRIEVYAREGKTLPSGWVIDRRGHSETDPNRVLEELVAGAAALTPLGGVGEEGSGYKGYGYATVVEILSAALTASPFMKALSGFDEDGNKIPYRLGHFFLVIDVEHFIDPEVFRKHAGDILRELRASDPAPGEERIYTAGEKEYLAWLERKDRGVPVDDALLAQIQKLKSRFSL